MSRYSTTSPSSSHTRLYRMRPLSLACTWWNLMSWSSVALYTLTGTFTSPKEIEPFQIERMLSVCPHRWADTRLSALRRGGAAGLECLGQRPEIDPAQLDAPVGPQQALRPQRIE